MNFALMFALALGIDYALFIVVRFRGAHFGRNRDVRHSVSETMDSAGKAVLFSGVTVSYFALQRHGCPFTSVPVNGWWHHAGRGVRAGGVAHLAARGIRAPG